MNDAINVDCDRLYPRNLDNVKQMPDLLTPGIRAIDWNIARVRISLFRKYFKVFSPRVSLTNKIRANIRLNQAIIDKLPLKLSIKFVVNSINAKITVGTVLNKNNNNNDFLSMNW